MRSCRRWKPEACWVNQRCHCEAFCLTAFFIRWIRRGKKVWGSSDKLSRQLPLLGFHCARNKRDPRLSALALCVVLSRSAAFWACDPSQGFVFHSHSSPQRQRPTHSPRTAAGGAARRLPRDKWACVWPMRDGAHGFCSLIQPGHCTCNEKQPLEIRQFVSFSRKTQNLKPVRRTIGLI